MFEKTEYFSVGEVITPSNNRRKIRWVIAHFPLDLFVRAAKSFADKVEQECPGELYFEIHTGKSFLDGYINELANYNLELAKLAPPAIKNLEDPKKTSAFDKKSVSTFTEINPFWEEVFKGLKNQAFEMSQTQINIIGSHLYHGINAIDMPYIFNSHDHVSAVLDGEIGKDISKKMAARTGITALGYTYSGGYRIIGSTDSVSCLDDLNTKNFISFTSPSGMLFDYAKVNHIPRHSATAADIGDMSEAGGAIETTYLRFAGKNVLKTNHSMFMTAILTSTDFLSSLTIKQQQAFKAAGDHVAKVERAWSIDDAEQYERDATSHGVTIVPISANDDLRLREAAKKMYTEDSIKKLKLDPKLVADIIAKGNNLK